MKWDDATLVRGTPRLLAASKLQGKPFTAMQHEILRAVELHGGITSEMTNRHGWTTHGGLPCAEFRELIDRLILAPRVLTSQPLRVVYQYRDKAKHSATLTRIEKETRRLGLREYAPGGFQLRLRKELA